MSEPIRFQATVEKVQQMPRDNAIRIWLDLPETALLEMARLAECRVIGQALDVVATPMKPEAAKTKLVEADYGL